MTTSEARQIPAIARALDNMRDLKVVDQQVNALAEAVGKAQVDPKRAKMTEKQVILEIVEALTDHGYRTPSFAAINGGVGDRGLFMRCQQHDARRSGSDKGLPDIWVYSFKRRAWFAFEAKRPCSYKARIYREQGLMAGMGITKIVTSAREVLEALESF